MSKKDVARAISKRSGLTYKKSCEIVDLFLEIITQSVINGNRVRLRGFGSFEVKLRAARTGRNKDTNNSIYVPPQYKISFVSSESLTKLLNSKQKVGDSNV